MAGIITKERIIEDAKIQQAFVAIGEKIIVCTDNLDKLVVAAIKANKELGGGDSLSKLTKGVTEATKSTEELTFIQMELAKQHQLVGKLTAQLETIESSYNKEIQKTRIEIQKKNAAIKEEITGDKAAAQAKKASAQAAKDKLIADKQAAIEASKQATSYNALNDELNESVRAYKAFTQAQRDDIAVGGAQLKKIQALDSELKQLDATMGRQQRNVGNYKSGFNGLQFSMMQVGRELPSLAYGFSTFIGAISNNIPMVTDEITRARKEIVRAKEAGEQSTPIWKQLGSAIFSWQTAMVVGLTVLTLYGREIATWAKGLFSGVSATEKLKIAQKRLNEANKKGYENGQQELVHIKLLYNATQNQATSMDNKRRAIKELQDQYPNYLGNFTEEEILAGKAGKAYYELANAIMSAAKAKAYEGIIVENEVKKFELELKVLEERKKLVKAQEDLSKLEKALSGIQSGNVGASSVARAAMDANSEIIKYTDSIGKLNTEISQLEYSSKELSDKISPTDLLFDSKNDKKKKEKTENEFTNLEKLKEQHKQELDEAAQFQSDLLANEQLTESQIIQAKADNARELIRIRMDQIKEEQKLSTPEQKSKLDSEYADSERKLQQATSNFIISEDKRLTKEQIEEAKRLAKEKADALKVYTDRVISDSVAIADEEKLSAQEVALEKIKASKGSKDAIETIQHELTLFMIDQDIAAQQRIIDTANLEPDAYAEASVRLRKLRLQRGEEDLSFTDKTEQEKQRIREEVVQASANLLNEGFNLSQQAYSNQAENVKNTYDQELKAAGDSVEGKIIAERKFEAESLKIRRRQAIAEKAQAVFSIGLSTYQAVMKVTAQTGIGAAVLVPLIIAAGALQLAAVLAKPIPQFFKGTKNAPETFIAGEQGSEAIIKPSGEVLLTPDKATMFSDKSFIGSTILPHDKTQQMLANYAVTQGAQVFLDMNKTNSILSSMDRKINGKDEKFIDGKGNLTIKRGNTTTHYATV